MGSKKVTLTIDGLDANQKKSSTKIQYVNPNASDDVMRTFANKCAALSTDTHTATTKTTDEDITNAETPKQKLPLTLNTADTFLFNMSNPSIGGERNTDIFDQTNLPVFTYKVEGDAGLLYNFCVSVYETGGHVCYATGASEIESTSETVTLTIYFEETATTAATTAQIVISYNGQPTLTIL